MTLRTAGIACGTTLATLASIAVGKHAKESYDIYKDLPKRVTIVSKDRREGDYPFHVDYRSYAVVWEKEPNGQPLHLEMSKERAEGVSRTPARPAQVVDIKGVNITGFYAHFGEAEFETTEGYLSVSIGALNGPYVSLQANRPHVYWERNFWSIFFGL